MVLDTRAAELTAHFFDTFADAYDDWFWGLHRRVAGRLVALAAARSGEACLDVGCGTGLVAHGLARVVGPDGQVVGLDVSEGMLSVARPQALPNTTFHLAAAEPHLPFRDGTFDLVVLCDSLAYLSNPAGSLEEARRVLRPAGRLLLRGNFSDHHPRPWWLEHFPRGLEADEALFQPLHEVIAMFTADGWRVASFGTVTEPSYGTRGDMLGRLRLRTLSFFAQLTPDEVEAGLRRLEQVVAADPGAPAPAFSEPLLTLERRS